MDKVFAAREAQYGAQPLVSKTAGWYTANTSTAEEKLPANWAALQAREASASYVAPYEKWKKEEDCLWTKYDKDDAVSLWELLRGDET